MAHRGLVRIWTNEERKLARKINSVVEWSVDHDTELLGTESIRDLLTVRFGLNLSIEQIRDVMPLAVEESKKRQDGKRLFLKRWPGDRRRVATLSDDGSVAFLAEVARIRKVATAGLRVCDAMEPFARRKSLAGRMVDEWLKRLRALLSDKTLDILIREIELELLELEGVG